MFNSKYSKTLTIVLIVIIVLIIGLLIFMGIDYYRKYYIAAGADDALGQFDDYVNNVQNNPPVNTTENNEIVENIEPNIDLNQVNNGQTGNNNSNNEDDAPEYKGYKMIGKIEIPKIDVEYPILAEATPEALELSICKLFGADPNEPGNMILVGHNFKDGTFFSNNKKLEDGDKIYITDLSGTRITYSIYQKYTTSSSDFDYAEKDTEGKRELSLSTCTDDTLSRLIIWAKED